MPGSTASGRAPREWLPALVLALLLASTAAADVTIQETTVSGGLGGFGDGTTRRTMIVAGDTSRSEDEAASGEGVTGKLGGLLGRKLAGTARKKAGQKVEKSAGEKASPGAAGGHRFEVATGVTSISTSPAPAGSFEVPAGHKLQKRD